MQELDDDTLARRAAGGDQAAFVQLAERHRRFLYAVAWRVLMNEDDALDVAQDVLTRLPGRLGQYRGKGGGFRAWLGVIASRAALDAARAPRRRERATDPETLAAMEGSSTPVATAQPPPDPRAEAVRHQRLERVEAAMRRLAPQQRAILVLRLKEDLTSAEIAENLGLPARQVRSQLSRAVARLRQWLVPGQAPSRPPRPAETPLSEARPLTATQPNLEETP